MLSETGLEVNIDKIRHMSMPEIKMCHKVKTII